MGLPDQATVMYARFSTFGVSVIANYLLLFLEYGFNFNLFQAYMYGFFKNKRIVLYDTLIQQVQTNHFLLYCAHSLFRLQFWNACMNLST
jgi:hypothetical protein